VEEEDFVGMWRRKMCIPGEEPAVVAVAKVGVYKSMCAGYQLYEGLNKEL
jgi:hypothetical protein